MEELYQIRPIAHIYTDFGEKFGIPRQSGLVEEAVGIIVFEKEFRDANALKYIGSFNYLWLIWSFSENRIDMSRPDIRWSPLVTPPRLGGKVKAGVWATRSPYRPNSLGLSSVKLLDAVADPSGNDTVRRFFSSGISPDVEGPVLIVSGCDILSGTPIFDIKPYVPYSDCHTDASSGFSVDSKEFLNVDFPEDLLELIPEEKREALIKVLKQDPRGSYEKQPGYVYGLNFAGFDIRFTIEKESGCPDVLHVFEVLKRSGKSFSKIK